MRIYTISAFSENSPGVLHRINTLLTRRKVNIESLTVSETEKKCVSRFTIVVNTTQQSIKTIVKQIARIIEVCDVFYSENAQLIYREIALFRVITNSPQQRTEIEELAHRYDAVVTYATNAYLVLEKMGVEEDIDSLYQLLEPFGIVEFVRSGRIAIRKTPRKEHIFEDEQGTLQEED